MNLIKLLLNIGRNKMEKIIYPCPSCDKGNKLLEKTGRKACKIDCEKYKEWIKYVEKKYGDK